jgi:hypothetical protein
MTFEEEEALRELCAIKQGKPVTQVSQGRKPFGGSDRGHTDDLAKCAALAECVSPEYHPRDYSERHERQKEMDLRELDRLLIHEDYGKPDNRDTVKDLRTAWDKQQKHPTAAVYPGLAQEYQYRPGDGCGLKDPTRKLEIDDRPGMHYHDEGYDDGGVAAVIIIKRKKNTKHRRIMVERNVEAVIMNR